MPTVSVIASSVVALLNAILPVLGTSSTGTLGVVISTLTQLLPVAVQEASDLVQPIKNIITAMSANPTATTEQLAALAALDAQCDAAFEAAAVAAGFGPDSGT